ncbi:hypothetical protein MAM1_0155d06781 [Mucor ambiguus]|uniref:Uncharacterized protein n=1 Tax=Mucor ambiguus TaxID=91626 RepID=A0A0C9LVS5_9FUNG|nr:hypothetical protein MAM1_0155d06781 [Mucor ambiguus]
MANTFSALSLKRNRSASASSKKESKLNAIISRLANSFQSNKKRKQFNGSSTSDTTHRRSSLSAIIDYFRSAEEPDEPHPFANDAWFEQNRYKQQKKSNNASVIQKEHTSSLPIHSTTGILMKHKSPKASLFNTNPQQPRYHHRHTQSTQSAITATTRRKKASHIRHYSHVSCISASNITVNSEDLTAKEFADIAGIRILSEDDDHDFEHDNEYSLMRRKICTFCGDEENDIPSLIITPSRITRNSDNNNVHNRSEIMVDDDDEEDDLGEYDASIFEQEPQIWDQGFWQRPGEEEVSEISSSSLSSSPAPSSAKPAKPTSSSSIIEPPPILHELKRNSQCNMALNQDTFIKKGRFEIHLNSARSSNMIESIAAAPKIQRPDASSSAVVEWKRKSKPTTNTTINTTNSLKHQVTA